MIENISKTIANLDLNFVNKIIHLDNGNKIMKINAKILQMKCTAEKCTNATSRMIYLKFISNQTKNHR